MPNLILGNTDLYPKIKKKMPSVRDWDLLEAENKQLKQKNRLLEQKLQQPQSKKNEATLPSLPEENQAKFQQAVDNLNLYGIEISKAGEIIYCNQYLLHITGYQAEEVIGKDYFEVFVPEDEQESRRIEYQKAMQRQGFWDNAARSFRLKSGEIRYINFNSVVLNYYQGDIAGLTKIGEDVTQQREVSLALRRSNEALQDLFDNSNDLIFISSTQGDLLFVNRAFKNKIGYTNEELSQLNVKDLIHESAKKSTYRKVLDVLKGETESKIKTILMSRKGKLIYLEGSVNIRFEQGNPVAVRGIMYDITDKIRAEKAQTLYYSIGNLTVKSKNLDQLYHTIHHELGKVIDVRNFYIKLYNETKTEILFPYYTDEARDQEAKIRRRRAGMGLTDYVMKREKALFLYEEEISGLLHQGKIKLFGPLPKIWIGVPLKFENEVIGLISVKCYRSRSTYNSSDLELLDFISGQIALAIQRKRNEEQLSNQTARLEAIFESSTHMMWSINRKYQLTSHNTNYLNSLHQQYELQAQPNSSLLNLREKLIKSDLYEFWEEKYRLAFKGEMQHFELKDKLQDNVYRWREVYLNPIRLEDGSIEEVSAISHDITEKKLSEIAMVESENKFRNIFESFQDIYYHTDLEGVVTLISPSIQEITGYPPEEILGKSIANIVLEKRNLSTLIEDLTREKRIKNFEITLKTKDGKLIQSISNIRLVYDDEDNPMGIEGVVRDITELKKATEEVLRAKEIAEHSLAVKESFLANMSHEIRTPMNGVIGMIDLMMDTPLSEEQYGYMHTIKKSSETLLHILNDILDLSKIEAGKMKLHTRPIDLRITLEKIYTLFMSQASRKGTELHYFIDESIPESLEIDETRLLQIIANLTSNAIKFTEKGHIWLRIFMEGQRKDKVKLKIEVQDSGIGIGSENVKLLFHTFSQLDNSSSKSYSGTGLGLAISKELTQLMKGKIGVKSKVGEGSTFWMVIESKISNESPVNQETFSPDFSSGNHFGDIIPRVLIVDDNAVNRKVAGEILRKAGCVIELASSGQECLYKIKNQEPHQAYDLIFMDIQMPDLDGVETTYQLRQIPKIKLPPIIAMTAYSMQEDREKFLSKGLDDYVAKPIKAQTLIKKVQEYLLAPEKEEIEKKTNLKGKLTKKSNTTEIDKVSILDMKVLDQLAKYGGKELIKESLKEFEDDTNEILKECEKGLRKKDWDLLRLCLHTLKGNAGTLGVKKVAEQATQIEKSLKTGNYPKIEADFETLAKYFAEFRENYVSLI
jgi:hypothetical protein